MTNDIVSIEKIRVNYFFNEIFWYGSLLCKMNLYQDRHNHAVQLELLTKILKYAEEIGHMFDYEFIYNETVWEPVRPQDYGNILSIKCHSRNYIEWSYVYLDISLDYKPILI